MNKEENTDLRELLECNKKMLLTVDEIIEEIPPQRSSSKQIALRILFMEARPAAHDICVLAESLLDNNNYNFSPSIEFSIRFIWEKTIDYFYIFENDDPPTNPVAQRYLDFLDVCKHQDIDDRKEKQKGFKEKYGNPGSDYWSGETRENKIAQGLNKQPKEYRIEISNVKSLFQSLNEFVHGNIIQESHWVLNKHNKFDRQQLLTGLFNISIFYFLFMGYCNFTGRGGEINRFEWYETHFHTIFSRNLQE